MEAGILILLVIAGVWAAFLLPPLFLVRRDTPLNTTQEFNKLTSRLAAVQAGHTPSAAALAVNRAQVLSRRRQILVALFATAVLTLGAAIVRGSFPLLILHLVVDAALVWYVMMLLQIKSRQQAAPVLDIEPLHSGDAPVRVVVSR